MSQPPDDTDRPANAPPDAVATQPGVRGPEASSEPTLGTDSLGTDSLGADSLGTDSLGTDSLGTDSLGTDSLGTDSLGPERPTVPEGEPLAALEEPDDDETSALWETDPVSDNGSESKRVTLGPLGLLGFGPKPETEKSVTPAQTTASALLTAAALVIVVAAMKVARPVLVPLVMSVFVATLTAPVVLYLTRRKVPGVIAVPAVVLLTLSVLVAVTGLVVGSLNAFVQALPSYQKDLISVVVTLSEELALVGVDVSPSNLLDMIQPGAVVAFVGQTLSEVADFLSSTLLIMLLTIFVLFEALVLPDKIRHALGDPNADLRQGIRMVRRVKAYVVVKTYTSGATGLIVGLSLEVVGIDFAFLWGMIAFLLNFIPNIGSIIAAVPAVLLALLQYGWSGAAITAGIFLSVNMVIGSLLEPRIMGRRMNLSPLIVFMSLIFWGWMWGPIGMLLSVPLTMVIRILLEGSEQTRPIAILMAGPSEDDPKTPPMSTHTPRITRKP